MKHVDIHFLNVGHGDCTFIDHPSGRLTMIDINNSKSLPMLDEVALAADKGISVETFKGIGVAIAKGRMSWNDYYTSLLVDPVDYYNDHFRGRSVFRYIQTHPDLDHMSGLCRFFWQEDVSVENVWDTRHEKTFTKGEVEDGPYDWSDWLVYQRMQAGKVQDGDEHKLLYNLMDDEGDYWTQDGIRVLGPTSDLIDYCNKQENWNNGSYVLSVEFGGRRIILPGDAEKPAWDSVEANFDTDEISCDILKAAHHGRESGYSESAVETMDPSIVICSVGKKPKTDASAEYKAHGAEVLSTRYHGSITVRVWADGEVWVNNHKGEQITTLPIL